MFLKRIAALAAAAALLMAQTAEACTGMRLIAQDGGVVAGRTLEFGIDLKSNVLVVPAGTAMAGTLPDGGKGLTYTTKYGMAGANAEDMNVIIDGLNDQGLYVGTFYFPGYAGYVTPTAANASRALAPYEFSTWLLANFANVDEVRANYDKVVLVPTVVEAIKTAPPVHVVVHDRSGKAIVIEPIDGKLVLHENPFGVMTNSPSFDWHMTNLSNYVNLSVTNVPQVKMGSTELQQTGQGSGLHGLPGDYTPPSRFVRAVVFSQSALPVATAPEAVLQLFHLLNAFDIPVGAVRSKDNEYDYTTWTSVSDLKNLRWYFRTYDDETIRSVDLRDALAAAHGQTKVIPMASKQKIDVVSTAFR